MFNLEIISQIINITALKTNSTQIIPKLGTAGLSAALRTLTGVQELFNVSFLTYVRMNGNKKALNFILNNDPLSITRK